MVSAFADFVCQHTEVIGVVNYALVFGNIRTKATFFLCFYDVARKIRSLKVVH